MLTVSFSNFNFFGESEGSCLFQHLMRKSRIAHQPKNGRKPRASAIQNIDASGLPVRPVSWGPACKTEGLLSTKKRHSARRSTKLLLTPSGCEMADGPISPNPAAPRKVSIRPQPEPTPCCFRHPLPCIAEITSKAWPPSCDHDSQSNRMDHGRQSSCPAR